LIRPLPENEKARGAGEKTLVNRGARLAA